MWHAFNKKLFLQQKTVQIPPYRYTLKSVSVMTKEDRDQQQPIVAMMDMSYLVHRWELVVTMVDGLANFLIVVK